MRLGTRERGGGWSAGKAGLQRSGTGRRRFGPVDEFEAESQYGDGGLGGEVGVSRTDMRLGREGAEADRLARQGSSAVVRGGRGGVGLARSTCLRLRANTGMEA